jgi:hypothetical protein
MKVFVPSPFSPTAPERCPLIARAGRRFTSDQHFVMEHDWPDLRHPTTDQKVGVSSPSESAEFVQVRAFRLGNRSQDGPTDITLISRAAEEGADPAYHLGLHGLGDMSVDVEGARCAVVAELLLDV